jgi:hypothetical protein
MNRSIRRVLVGAAVFGIVAGMAPAATANAAGDDIRGGCFFDSDANALTGSTNVGDIGDLSVTTGPDGLPTGATVTCFIRVNGVEAPGTRFSYSGTGVQAGANPITFIAGPTDNVDECQEVTYADGTTEPLDCPPSTRDPIPPQPIVDAIHEVFIGFVDPLSCPVLVALGQATGGGIAGTLEIGADGDLYLVTPIYTRIYDCPPY